MLHALIFDVDGTLAETEETHRRAFNATFAARGLGWVWDRPLYIELLRVTGGKERIAHYIAAHGAEPALAGAEIAALHEAKTARYTELMRQGTCGLRPGIVRLLDEAAAAGMRLAIATTTSLPNVVALLEATLGPGAAARFEVIAAGDMVAAKKPAPDVFLLALRELGLAPGDALAVEDSRNGLLSARAAGLPVLITQSAFTAHEDFAGAAAVVDSLGEPDTPARVLAGDLPGPVCVDLAALRRLHAATAHTAATMGSSGG